MKALKNDNLIKTFPHYSAVQRATACPRSVRASRQSMKSKYISFHEAKSWWALTWTKVSFGAGHYLSWVSNLKPESEASSEGVSKTGLTNPSNSASALCSGWVLTKSFSHSSALESSEAEAGPLFICLLPGLRAARRMSSSVRDLSQAGSARLIPTMQGHEFSFWQQESLESKRPAGRNVGPQMGPTHITRRPKTWHVCYLSALWNPVCYI